MDNKELDKQINLWLQNYEPISEIAQYEDIHYDSLSTSVKNLALQRTGFESLPLRYITSRGWYRQYTYMLLLKSGSEIDEQKLVNLDWLDNLSDWLEEQNINKTFPELKDGKKVISVGCANALTYDESEDGSESVYSLQLYFNIRKEN